MRRPYIAFAALIAGSAGCLLLTRSRAIESRPDTPRERSASVRLSPNPLLNPFAPPKVSELKTSPLPTFAPAPFTLPEPMAPMRPSGRIPPAGKPTSNSVAPIQIRHDPQVLSARSPVHIQILLAKASETDTRVELTSDSRALPLPRAIVIPAGHAMSGIRLTAGEISQDATVNVSASLAGAAGKAFVSRAAIPIQAIPAK